VLTPGQCTTIHWQATNVSLVFVDNQSVAFSGTKQDCPTQTVNHLLHVVTLDNQNADRTVTVQVVSPTDTPPSQPPAPATHTPQPPQQAQVSSAIKKGNLIVNGDAEASSSAQSWSAYLRTPLMAVASYGAPGGFPDKNSPGPSNRGKNFFAGGPGAVDAAGGQLIDLTSWGADAFALIDASKVSYQFGAWLGGYADQDDSAKATVSFLPVNGPLLGQAILTGPNAAARNNKTSLVSKNASGKVPPGTRKIEVLIQFARASGDFNDGSADDLSLTLAAQ
jgi:hypothetical protein